MSEQTELNFANGQRRKEAGQRQAASALPPSVRLTIGSCLRCLARSGVPFAIAPNLEGHPDLLSQLPPMTKEIVSRHKNSVGAIVSALSNNHFLKRVGYCTASGESARSHALSLWTIHPDAR